MIKTIMNNSIILNKRELVGEGDFWEQIQVALAENFLSNMVWSHYYHKNLENRYQLHWQNAFCCNLLVFPYLFIYFLWKLLSLSFSHLQENVKWLPIFTCTFLTLVGNNKQQLLYIYICTTCKEHHKVGFGTHMCRHCLSLLGLP